MTEELLKQVKRKLNVTWEDVETSERIKDIINSAIPDLKHKLGITAADFDFSVAGTENTLFLAYCLYEWNHCLNEFDENYARLIAQVRARYAVERYASVVTRGTTPTHTFDIPMECSFVKEVAVIYAQNDTEIFRKTTQECKMEGAQISVTLTQEETLRFSADYSVQIQLRIITVGNDSLVSDTINTTVAKCLNNEVM